MAEERLAEKSTVTMSVLASLTVCVFLLAERIVCAKQPVGFPAKLEDAMMSDAPEMFGNGICRQGRNSMLGGFWG